MGFHQRDGTVKPHAHHFSSHFRGKRCSHAAATRTNWVAPAHVYWMKDVSLSRIELATGNEQLVARLEIVDPETIAVTREWIFVSDASNAGGILRVRKPAP